MSNILISHNENKLFTAFNNKPINFKHMKRFSMNALCAHVEVPRVISVQRMKLPLRAVLAVRSAEQETSNATRFI